MIRIAILEDEPLLLELLTKNLNEAGGIEVIGSATSGSIALSEIDATHVEVAVLDIDLGVGPDGIEVAQRWRKVNPDIGLVFMTNLMEPLVMLLAENNYRGGLSYLPKRKATSIGVLLECIRSAAEGEVMVEESMASSLPDVPSGMIEISPHQQRILRAIATGASNKKIANDLGITPKSVENATASALRLLGIDGTDTNINVRVLAALTYLRMAING